MIASGQVPNPRYIGAPARMADGRLFTDYHRTTRLLPALKPTQWADWERRQEMLSHGQVRVRNDRMTTTLRAGSMACVDTMVPELSKWQYTWEGGNNAIAHPVGIGAGRLYLPGRPGLRTADPDVVATATFPMTMLHGCFDPNPQTYYAVPVRPTIVDVPVKSGNGENRYSAPYGN